MSYNEEMQARNTRLGEILAAIQALPGDAVRYGLAQSLTEAQKVQARANIGALAGSEEELAQIAAMVIEDLGGRPVYGIVEEGTKAVVLRNAPTDGYTFYYELEDGSRVEIGVPEVDTNTYYSVTNNLTNCVSSNSAVQAVGGESYAATITANSGYELESVAVTMGGAAVAVSGGKISIASVTGDIVITAVAKEVPAEADPTNFFKSTPTVSTAAAASQDALVLGGRLGSDGGYRVDGGPDCLLSNYIPVQSGDVVYIKNADVYSSLSSGLYKSDKTTISTFLLAGSTDVTANNTASGQNQYTVVNTNAAYLRLCLKPAASIKVNQSGADASLRYDCSQIVVNVKRNGAWL